MLSSVQEGLGDFSEEKVLCRTALSGDVGIHASKKGDPFITKGLLECLPRARPTARHRESDADRPSLLGLSTEARTQTVSSMVFREGPLMDF